MSARWEPPSDVTCRLTKQGCRHDELFHETYQRANRAHGVKILRCFPHCCPVHLPRSYCGGSLELQVDGCGFPVTQLLVYARFRPQEDGVAPLRVGEWVARTAVEARLQSDTNPSGEWIESAVRVPQELVYRTHNSLRFQINPSGRWYYSWRSGKLSTKRLTKHVLETVVFVGDSGSDSLRVLASAESSAFTVVSFRRVTSMAETRPTVWSPPKAVERATPPPDRFGDRSAAVDFGAVSEASFHRHIPCSFAEELAAVYALVKAQSVGVLKPLIPAWSLLVDGASSDTVPPAVEIGAARTLQAYSPTVTAAHLVWWLALDRDVHTSWSHCVALASAHLTIDDEAVRHLFNEWTQWLQSHVAHFLERLGGFTLSHLAGQSVPNPDSHPFDWRNFIAQTREEMVVRSFRQPPENSTVSSEWICPFRNISISHSTSDLGSALDQLSVVAIIAFWQQLSCIRITLDTANPAAPELVIASARNSTTSQRFARLSLDNRHRWFSAMPDGMSTLRAEPNGAQLCDLCFGDYLASLHDDGTVEVTMFSWPGTVVGAPYRWSWRFLVENLTQEHLQVDVSVHVGHVLPSELSYSGYGGACSSVHDKLAHVRRWAEEYQARLTYTRLKQELEEE